LSIIKQSGLSFRS